MEAQMTQAELALSKTACALSRRKFLGRSTLGLAAASVTPALGFAAAPFEADPAWRCRLSTSSIHFKPLPLEQACQRIAELGFEAIDLWSAYQGCRHLDDAQALGPDGLRELLRKNRLKLSAFSCYVGGYEKYAQLLGQTGGGVAIQGSAPPCSAAELTAKMRLFLEGLKPMAELAEKHRSFLAIENHGDSLLNSLDSFKAFVDLNQSPRLGLALAPYHLQANGASVEAAIRICGRQLLFFYAWQNQPGTGQLPGHGPTDFTPWLQTLAKINYEGYVNPFMHGETEPDVMSAALVQAREYLKKCAARA
jgi:sugar phosphate isomerase/epimerase